MRRPERYGAPEDTRESPGASCRMGSRERLMILMITDGHR